MECEFLVLIKAVYTQPEYSWTVKSANANTIVFFFFLFVVVFWGFFVFYFVICKHCLSAWLVIKLAGVEN